MTYDARLAPSVTGRSPRRLCNEPASRFPAVAIELDPEPEAPGPETSCLFSSQASLLSSGSLSSSSCSSGGGRSNKLRGTASTTKATTNVTPTAATDRSLLPREARIDYGRLVVVDYDVKVLFVGTVAANHWRIVRDAADQCWAEREALSSEQA